MIYSFIRQHRDVWPIGMQRRTLDVSRSGFYAWLNRSPSKRTVANQNLLQDIRRLHWDNHKRYGSPRVHAALRAEGHHVSRKRIARLMRDNDLRAISKKQVRITATDSKHNLPVADNRLDRNFGALAPNENGPLI
jgi:putative transposase